MATISKSNAQIIGISNYFEGLRMVPESWRNVFSMHGDRVAALRINALTGVGEVPGWDGASDLSTTGVDNANALEIDYAEYGLQIRIAKRKAELTPGLVAGASSKLGVAVASTYRTAAYSELDGAFSNTIADGQALCADAHTTASGATRDNLITSAFDRTAFMSLIQAARNWVSYNNITYDLADLGWYVVIDPKNEETAAEVFGSSVSSSEMQVNAASRYMADYQVETCFTDDDDWLMVSKAETPFRFWELDGPDFRVDIDEDNGAVKLSVDFAIAADAGPQPDGVFGSNVA